LTSLFDSNSSAQIAKEQWIADSEYIVIPADLENRVVRMTVIGSENAIVLWFYDGMTLLMRQGRPEEMRAALHDQFWLFHLLSVN
jgi:hypothetical protein